LLQSHRHVVRDRPDRKEFFMRRFIASAIALAAIGLSLSACVVAEPARPGCVMVPGHYGPEGGWHPPHCRG
jgi:hypothetical protein